jgi:hypothetical protein
MVKPTVDERGSLRLALALLANIRLGWKDLIEKNGLANAPAYLASSSVTKKKV